MPSIQGAAYLSDFEAKKALIELSKRLYERGWAIGGDGSLSIRTGPNAVWTVVADADKASLAQGALVRVELSGRQAVSLRPLPLCEDLPLHLQLYRDNPALRCVLHAYPPSTVALLCRGESLAPQTFTPAVRRLGGVPLIAPQGTEQLAFAVSSLSRTSAGALLPEDGCMLWADSPLKAYQQMEALEYAVKMIEHEPALKGVSAMVRPGDTVPNRKLETKPAAPQANAIAKTRGEALPASKGIPEFTMTTHRFTDTIREVGQTAALCEEKQPRFHRFSDGKAAAPSIRPHAVPSIATSAAPSAVPSFAPSAAKQPPVSEPPRSAAGESVIAKPRAEVMAEVIRRTKL